MSIIQGNAHTSAGGGTPAGAIASSLRFNPSDTAYLSRTLGTSNRRTFTFSAWIKRSLVTPNECIFGNINYAGGGSTNQQFALFWGSGDQLYLLHYNNGTQYYLLSSSLYRDPSAWYHVVCAIDTTNATSTNRLKLYVNGTQVTNFLAADYPPQNTDTFINANLAVGIGTQLGTGIGNSYYLGGYMAEVNFIDGQALTPSDFGETDTNTGVWKPKAFSGTYGTNGFYLKFADNSGTTSTTLGKDSSGNGNNWTPNNFSVTAGAGNDSMVDSPTAYGTDTGVGGEVRGNYCTMNPLNAFGFASGAISNGNLNIGNGNGSVYGGITSTMRIPTSVPIYAEFTVTGSAPVVGITTNNIVGNNASRTFGDSATDWVLITSSGNKENNNSSTSYGSGFSVNDVGMIAVDTANGKVWFGKNGTWFNSGVPASGTNAAFTNVSGEVYVATENDSDDSVTFNFGQRAFAYTAPSGFKALCTQNLPTPTIGATSTTQAGKYFNPILWTATDAASRALTGVGFQPDFLWAKSRNTAGVSHRLYDAVRGATTGSLVTDSTAAEDTTAGQLTSFNTDGFTTGTNKDYLNYGSRTYVGWCWKANGAGSSNTAGTITSTVSANTTSGFSIVTFTADSGTNNFTVGHGLGVTPSMVIVKSRTNAVAPWYVYHSSLVTDGYLRLNATNAVTTDTNQWGTGMTSTVIGLRAGYSTVASTTTVAYCFAPVAGYSAFGSYTGNFNADGPFVFTGMRPRYIMIKRTDAAAVWFLFDTARNPSNNSANYLTAESSNAEGADAVFDILSNGFKLRVAANSYNANGGTYIYMAFAESPFKYSLAR